MSRTPIRISTAVLLSALTSACAPPEDEDSKVDVEQSEEALTLSTPTVTIVDTTGSIAGFGTGSVTAACPTSSILTGGGFRNPNALFMVGTRAGTDDASWRSSAYNGTGGSRSLLSEALCLRNVTATSYTIEQSVTIPAQSSACAAAACPANTKLTGGGFYQNMVGPRVYASYPLTNESWYVCTKNESNNTATLRAYARCVSLPAGSTISRIVTGSVSVGPGGTGNAYAYCPANTRVVGGGYLVPYLDWTVMRSESFGSYFRVEARNNTTGTNGFQAIAHCLALP